MKLLREPLVHFLLLGAALFGVFALVGDRGSERAEPHRGHAWPPRASDGQLHAHLAAPAHGTRAGRVD